MSASLKPCPFCGGDARVAAMSFDEDSAEVGCGQPDCHAVAFVACDTEAEGIAAWNRRSDPSREAMREALERAILGIQAGLDLAVATRRADHESFFRNRIKDARAALALDGDAK